MKRIFFLSFLVLQYVYKNTVNIKILLNKDSSEFCGYKILFFCQKSVRRLGRVYIAKSWL